MLTHKTQRLFDHFMGVDVAAVLIVDKNTSAKLARKSPRKQPNQVTFTLFLHKKLWSFVSDTDDTSELLFNGASTVKVIGAWMLWKKNHSV